ncbi:MAG: hypothetical protein ACTS2F_16460 [Thainema sp.]
MAKRNNKPPKQSAFNAKNPLPSNIQPSSNKIPRPSVQSGKRWAFSFKYWDQIEHFGLDNDVVRINWFISFLEKLKELSREPIERVMNDQIQAKAYRFHIVNWNQRNIPISKNDLDWIPSEIRESEEFDFYQFQLSTSTGRIIGYFDVDYVFQIVLLDPKHNLQPSRNFGYKVDRTRELNSDYQILQEKLVDLDETAKSICDEECGVRSKIADLASEQEIGRYVFLEDILCEKIEELCNKKGYDYVSHLLLDAIITLESEMVSE